MIERVRQFFDLRPGIRHSGCRVPQTTFRTQGIKAMCQSIERPSS